MKKLINLLEVILLILLYNLTSDKNMLLLCLSFSMYILLSSFFSTTSIKSLVDNYNKKGYLYSKNKIFKYTSFLITFIILILMVIVYFTGVLLNIKGILLVDISMILCLLSYTIIHIEGEYLSTYNNKIFKNFKKIYKILNILLMIILSILLFKVLKVDSYTGISILYSVNFITLIIINIFLYIYVFKEKKYTMKREEVKINYLKQIKGCIITNKKLTIYNLIKSAYLYFSIIILYYLLLKTYNYSYESLSIYITNTYFYGIILIYYIYKLINNICIKDYSNLKNKIINKEDVSKSFHIYFNKQLNISFIICILLMVISNPIAKVLFKSSYNFIFNLIPLLFFYIIYDSFININIIINKEKNIVRILLSGLIITLLSSIPLIAATYRMGQELVLGSISSIILGLGVSIVIGAILIKNKLKIVYLENFNNILNIVYENIIYTVVLVVLTLIVKIDVSSIMSNILIIIFYIAIAIIYIIIRNRIKKIIR